jgi:hypothetical protein
MSGTVAVPYLSFADVALDGEQFSKIAKNWIGPEDPSYLALFPLEKMQAEFMTQQVGLVPCLLPQLSSLTVRTRFPGILKREHPTREMLALALMHDMLVWPIECNRHVVGDAYAVLARFNTGAEDVTFHPYWDQRNQEAAGQPGFKLSYYARPHEILAVLVNTLDRQQSTTMRLAKLDMAHGKVMDAETDKPIARQDGNVEISIPARDFRLIRISQ